MNPPYGRECKKFIKKAYEEGQKPGTLVCCLIAARTDTAAFHDYILHSQLVYFIRGRLRFLLDGDLQDAAPFPSMVVIFNGDKKDKTEKPKFFTMSAARKKRLEGK